MNDTTKEANDVQVGIYRRMTPEEKLLRVFGAYETGRRLAMAGLRERFPLLDEAELWKLWAKQHLGEKFYKEVYESAGHR